MTTRLHLLCSASTSSVGSVAFPADEPLDVRGRESLAKFVGKFPSCDVVLRGPALCAAQTAEGLALQAIVDPVLRNCDFGRWTGHSFADIQASVPDEVARWLQDPRAAPHGGESFADVMIRIGKWLDDLLSDSGSILAITHASVVRAAIAHGLDTGPEVFRHIDVAPLTRASLSGGGGRWKLVSLISPRDLR